MIYFLPLNLSTFFISEALYYLPMDVRDGDVVKGTVDGQLLGGADIVPGNLLM